VVLLEKDGEDRLDRSCGRWRSVTESEREERNILHTVKGDRLIGIGHILRESCLLKHANGGSVDERMEVIHGMIEVIH